MGAQHEFDLIVERLGRDARTGEHLEFGQDGVDDAQLVEGDTRAVLAWAELALVKSGTVTLETALAGVPMVVVYKMSAVTALVARAMLRVQHVSLPNLLLDRALVPELLQEAATPEAMATALEDVLQRRPELQSGYRELREKLGGPGAAEKVAQAVIAAAATAG